MATSIPPHNLGEAIDACVKLIEDEDADIEDLIKIVKGPDFPTGAIIMGKKSIQDAYRTGQGKVLVRAKTQFEETKKGRTQIIVTEIPFQVNKARLIEKIAPAAPPTTARRCCARPPPVPWGRRASSSSRRSSSWPA